MWTVYLFFLFFYPTFFRHSILQFFFRFSFLTHCCQLCGGDYNNNHYYKYSLLCFFFLSLSRLTTTINKDYVLRSLLSFSLFDEGKNALGRVLVWWFLLSSLLLFFLLSLLLLIAFFCAAWTIDLYFFMSISPHDCSQISSTYGGNKYGIVKWAGSFCRSAMDNYWTDVVIIKIKYNHIEWEGTGDGVRADRKNNNKSKMNNSSIYIKVLCVFVGVGSSRKINARFCGKLNRPRDSTAREREQGA